MLNFMLYMYIICYVMFSFDYSSGILQVTSVKVQVLKRNQTEILLFGRKANLVNLNGIHPGERFLLFQFLYSFRLMFLRSKQSVDRVEFLCCCFKPLFILLSKEILVTVVPESSLSLLYNIFNQKSTFTHILFCILIYREDPGGILNVP